MPDIADQVAAYRTATADHDRGILSYTIAMYSETLYYALLDEERALSAIEWTRLRVRNATNAKRRAAGLDHGRRCQVPRSGDEETAMTVWITSDWHLGHRNILDLGPGRPFASIDEHDESLIERHNNLVKPNDVVWVLGDVAMGDITQSLAKCARMNGRKILVCGNHDRPEQHADTPERRDRWIERYQRDGGFSVVLTRYGNQYVYLPNSKRVAVSHYPYAGENGPERTDRYADRRPIDVGLWLLHGHVHDQWQVNGRQINVGVDVWGYEPVPVERLSDLISDLSEER